MIYAGEQGPWRSWTHVLSKSNKTIGEKCYQLGWNPDPLTSNSGRPAEDPQPSPPVQPIPPALRSQTVNNRFHSCCLLVRCTSPSILSGSDYADVFAGAQASISPQPHLPNRSPQPHPAPQLAGVEQAGRIMGRLGRHLVGIHHTGTAILHTEHVGIGAAGAVIAAEVDQFG